MSASAAFDGALFIYEWSRHWVKVVHLNAEANVSRIEPLLPDYKFVRPIDMEFGPDGSLYVIEYGESWGVNPDTRLIRIDYIRGNRAPVAIAAAENNFGKQPLAKHDAFVQLALDFVRAEIGRHGLPFQIGQMVLEQPGQGLSFLVGQFESHLDPLFHW